MNKQDAIEMRFAIAEWEKSILEVDPFKGDWDGDLRVFKDRIIIAKKTHECFMCGGKITKGSSYRYYFSKFDGDVMEHKWCKQCCIAMIKQNVAGDWEYVNAREKLREMRTETTNG